MNTPNMPDRFAIVDENGWIIFENRQIEDPALAAEFYRHLHYLPNRSFASSIAGHNVIVEAFDCPLIVQTFSVDDMTQLVTLEFNYGYKFEIKLSVFKSEILSGFFLDAWDRVYGQIKQGIPFVFSKEAHNDLLDSLDEFDDDAFVFCGQRTELKPLWPDEPQASSKEWWDKAYTGEVVTISSAEIQKSSAPFAVNPGWNIDSPAETLKDMLHRMKLPVSRVLILGCGDGYDAAFFAQNGHKVTAVDISHHAIERGKNLFGHMSNITWVQSDLFKLPDSFNNSFDLVYEYTCFCAINPSFRKDLVQVWSKCLHEQGQLMATFFCMHKRDGPPFGASEWEIRELMKKRFQTLIWTRWRKSIPRRQGRELYVLAQKRKLL